MTFVVREVSASHTHELRCRVLRDGDPDAEVTWAGDDDADTVHLAVISSTERIIGVSTWLRSPDPLAPDVAAVQLRGMASDPEATGRGVATRLVRAGIEHCRNVGARRLWANARVTAVGFYESVGFEVQGPVFVTEATGLAHRHMHLAIS
ncbi:MAG: GNAT family N-acetyltransferase [Ilumatobacter sp.]